MVLDWKASKLWLLFSLSLMFGGGGGADMPPKGMGSGV